MKQVFFLFGIIFFPLYLNAQSLPQLNKDEGRIFYNRMQNIFNIDLNGSDAGLLKLKMRNAQIGKLNDSTYQVMYRGVLEHEVKLKLYYKNLPVDVFVLETSESPMINISLPDTARTVYTLKELAKQSLNYEIADPFLKAQGYIVSSYQVKSILNKNQRAFTIMSMNSPQLRNLTATRKKVPVGSKLIFSDFRIKSKRNAQVLAQNNYIEVTIK